MTSRLITTDDSSRAREREEDLQRLRLQVLVLREAVHRVESVKQPRR